MSEINKSKRGSRAKSGFGQRDRQMMDKSKATAAGLLRTSRPQNEAPTITTVQVMPFNGQTGDPAHARLVPVNDPRELASPAALGRMLLNIGMVQRDPKLRVRDESDRVITLVGGGVLVLIPKPDRAEREAIERRIRQSHAAEESMVTARTGRKVPRKWTDPKTGEEKTIMVAERITRPVHLAVPTRAPHTGNFEPYNPNADLRMVTGDDRALRQARASSSGKFERELQQVMRPPVDEYEIFPDKA